MYKYVNDVVVLNKISVAPPRLQCQRQTPSQLNDWVVMETTRSRRAVSSVEDYKVTLFFPVLDAMIIEF